MRRWGQIGEHRPDAWYEETARKVYKPDIYLEAARLLVAEGKASEADFPWDSDGFRAPTDENIDGTAFDARSPNDFIDSLAIGLKDRERIEGNAVVGG